MKAILDMKAILIIFVVGLFLLAGCKDISGSYKPGSFGASAQDQKIVDYYKAKYGDLTASGTPRILEPLMSSDVQNYIPSNKVIKFSKDTTKLYAWFVYDNFKENDMIAVEWKYLSTNFVIYTFNSSAGGDFGRGVFILEKPDTGWPLGKYEVTISGMGATSKMDFEVIDGATVTEPLPFDTGAANASKPPAETTPSSSDETTPPSDLGDELYTNNNIAGCSYTDTSTFTLPEEVYVAKLRMWYYWNKDEVKLPYTLTKDGVEYSKGDLVRASCDPYQTSWCEANIYPKKNMPAGKYVMTVANKRMCQNSGTQGNGMYGIYGKKLGAATNSNTAASTGISDTKTASGFDIKNTACSFAGKWSTNWNDMTLVVTGNKVTGTYAYQGGKITGTINKNVLVGSWGEEPSYAPPSDAGDIEFMLSDDCKSFSGNWRYGSTGTWSGGWTGTYVSG